MREILFRGKGIETGEWIYGFIIHQAYFRGVKVDNYLIFNCTDTKDGNICSSYLVDPETVGEFTGLYDKNGTRIFEGDIVYVGDSKEPLYVCQMDFEWVCIDFRELMDCKHRLEYRPVKYEVIGNKFDNPDLYNKMTDITYGMTKEEKERYLQMIDKFNKCLTII